MGFIMNETSWLTDLITDNGVWFYNINKKRFEPPSIVYYWYLDYDYRGYFEDLWRYPVIWKGE